MPLGPRERCGAAGGAGSRWGQEATGQGLALQTGCEPRARSLTQGWENSGSPPCPTEPSLELGTARLECVYLWPNPISCFLEKGLREGC